MKRRFRSGLGLAASAAALLALAACSKKAPSALEPAGPASQKIAGVWWLMFGLAAAVYVVVAGLIIFAALRGRRRSADDEPPSRITDGQFIVIGGLIVPTLILAILGVATIRTTNALSEPEPGALKIEVTGFQWWWAVRYPTADINTANEIRIPAERPVEISLETVDVLHSFWVPELAGKVDLVPGQRNIIRLQADKPGVYRGQCAEYCGLQHAKMAFLVVAEPASDFQRWVERQQRPRGGPTNERQAFGEIVFNRAGCGGCHAIKGTAAAGTIGPDLSDFGSRRTIGAVSLPNNRGNLAGWISDSQSIKPENLMPAVNLSSDELLALVEYLESQR